MTQMYAKIGHYFKGNAEINFTLKNMGKLINYSKRGFIINYLNLLL